MFHKIEPVFHSEYGPFHCSTVCNTLAGPLVAAYCGQECSDNQRVVLKLANGGATTAFYLPKKTGNPVLWNWGSPDGVWLLYSFFEDELDDGWKPANPVDRWKSCSLWLQRFQVTEAGRISRVGAAKPVPDGLGKLGRCAPLKMNDGSLLVPLYRERDPLCCIYKFDDGELTPFSTFGGVVSGKPSQSHLGEGVAIQPTLFWHNNRIVARCRNVVFRKQPVEKRFVWSAQSEDCGKTWDFGVFDMFMNHGSSLHTFDAFGYLLTIADINPGRKSLELFGPNTSITLNTKIPGWKESYSYPNACVDTSRDLLYITHTNCGHILMHAFSREFLDFVFGTNKRRII